MNEDLVQKITNRVAALLQEKEPETAPAALLVGGAPTQPLGYRYVSAPPYTAVVIGQLTYTELLYFREETVFSALAEGIPVYLWAQGLPHRRMPCKSRPLLSRLAAAERELRSLGILLLDGNPKRRFISGEEAQRIRASGAPVPPGAVLSPLAKDILTDGKEQAR